MYRGDRGRLIIKYRRTQVFRYLNFCLGALSGVADFEDMVTQTLRCIDTIERFPAYDRSRDGGGDMTIDRCLRRSEGEMS